MGLTVKGFLGDVCRVLWFVCRLERDFKVLGSRYRIFSVFRERNSSVRVSLRLVVFFRVLMVFMNILWLWVEFVWFPG